MTSSAQPRANARDALIEAAKLLFIERGYEAVSTRDVADTAGVNLGSIQYYFGSKAKLFIEVMHQLMKGSLCATASQALAGEIKDSHEAGVKLCHFIRMTLESFLHPNGPQPCRLMFREIFTNTSKDPEIFEALVSSVTSDFIKPADEVLRNVVKHLVPDASSEAVELAAQSIIGQCSYYLTHGPFVQRLRGKDYAASPHFEAAARHIAEFSLRALVQNHSAIDSVLDEAFPSKRKKIISLKGKRG
jgi:TetR/AcrR family transcriptional regulator, regulator of cefoperazone and chloramphenicol sensitivity